MQRLLDRLRSGGVLIGDGAIGTMLMARGLKPGEPPESINLSNPGMLEAIAREYVAAGAEIVTTNTLGGSPQRLREYGLDGETEAINRAAVAAARRGAGDRAYVSASVGPSGRLLKPHGDATHEEVGAGFERQIRALAAAGVDLICIETMTDLTEAVLAVRAARLFAATIPLMATMTFERTRRGFFTVMGVTIAQAAGALREAGADIVGSNCGNGIDRMIEIAREFRSRTTQPIAIHSNAGLPQARRTELVYAESPAYMAERVPTLVDAGVQIIGGCCGTTPAHIRAIRAAAHARA